MELSEDEEEDDFQEMCPTYDESELFSHDDHHSRRKQDPLSMFWQMVLNG